MKTCELLSPAGSYESGVAAIQNGCDAIYLGGTRFGARAFANNFDEAQMRDVVSYAHAYGVRVYITFNTLVFEQEWDDACAYIETLYNIGVDALIVQDLGVLSYLRKNYPDLEVHASTQMHIVNAQALLFLQRTQVKRAVLAREVHIDEMKALARVGVELEVFVHGALCVGYSGQCLMSQRIGGRSANRGECAQSCRMPYTLCEYESERSHGDESYLLSMQDLNTVEHIQALQAVGVYSFKIEGRMKKSEYVGYVTALYRDALHTAHYKISNTAMKQTKLLFNRGFTTGFLHGQRGSHLYNPHRPNHIGIPLGTVLSSSKDKIRVSLVETLHQNDGVRILRSNKDHGFKVNRIYEHGLLVNHANKGSVVDIECHVPIEKGSALVKTSDPILEKEIRIDYERVKRKVDITMTCEAVEGEPLRISVSDATFEVQRQGDSVLAKANKHATSRADVEEKLRKINDTIFHIDRLDIVMQGAPFVPLTIVNQLRREALAQLYEMRLQHLEREHVPYAYEECAPYRGSNEVCASVLNHAQLMAALEMDVDVVYVKERPLFESYKENPRVRLSSARVEKNGYQEVTLIQDIGGLLEGRGVVCDAPLNVCNVEAALFCLQQGATKICASWELAPKDVVKLADTLAHTHQQYEVMEAVVYGRCAVMVSEHCPINARLLDNDKKGCTLCRHKVFALRDTFHNVYPMHNDAQCRMHLYDYRIQDHRSYAKQYKEHGVSMRYEFTFENAQEVKRILASAKSQ